MTLLEKYLKHLSQKTESMFPIDSISSGKPFKMPLNRKGKSKFKENEKTPSIIGQ